MKPVSQYNAKNVFSHHQTFCTRNSCHLKKSKNDLKKTDIKIDITP